MTGAVVVVALGVLTGCGSSSKTTATTATPTGGAGSGSSTTAGGGGSGEGGSGSQGDQNGQLGAIASSIKSGKQATFKASYTYHGGATTEVITIEQKPPKTLFKSGDAEVIGTGTTTYYCATSGAQPSCFNAGSANPLSAITQLFNPDNAETAIQEAEAQVAAHQAGYNVSFSTESFAGASSNCVTVTSSSVTGKYCVTKSGVLAYSGTATANFQLSSYSTSVSDSDFSLPAGASTATIPGIP